MNRILDNDIMGDEEFVERTLRPQYLKEYIGQDKKQQNYVMNHLTMCYCLALRVLVRRQWHL